MALQRLKKSLDKIVELEEYSEEIQKKSCKNGQDNRSQLAYRATWARHYLKAYGALDNSTRGVYPLTEKGRSLKEHDVSKIPATVKKSVKPITKKEPDASEEKDDAALSEDLWKETLINILLKISPQDFERLAQRILRESGFTKVEITGRSGDGGIDGIGVLKVNLLSFHVLFQCKRYKGSVSSPQIRDFRGAMMGRSDKGLFITTGSFTSDARKEATRDGAPAIDLIDGDALCELLKNLKLGVSTETVEKVTVNNSWFSDF